MDASPYPMAALLAAVRDADDGGGLIAALPVGGRTVIERQAALAARAGAMHLVVLVERVPAGLTAAIDRLRHDGLTIEVARSAGDAADRFHPDERVLVLADGALAGDMAMTRLATGPAPALLTLGEVGPEGGFERIDAATRWAGIALVSGDFLRRTVAMLGDWDLHSTLLRRTAAVSGRRIDVADRAELADPEPALLVRSRAGARLATQTMLDRPAAERDWPSRFVGGPIAGLVLPAILDRRIEAAWLRWASLAVTAVAVAAVCWWPLWSGLGLAVLGAWIALLARRLDFIRAGVAPSSGRAGAVRVLLLAAMMAVWAVRWSAAGPVPPLLAGAVVAVAAALARETASLRTVAGRPDPRWLADPDALVLVLLPFAVAGHPIAGLAVAIAYAGVAFAYVQHRLARGLEGLAPR